MKQTWCEFLIEFENSNVVYNFIYKDLFIFIEKIQKKRFGKYSEHCELVVHRHDNNGILLYEKYDNPQSLIENARFYGKTLKEIWDELEE